MIPTIRPKWLVVIALVLVFVFPLSNTHAELAVDSSLSVSELYTDNLFFTFAKKRDDFGTIVTPSVKLIFSNKHIKVGGSYAATAQFYVNNPGANTVGHGLNIDTDFPFLNRFSKQLEFHVNEAINFSPSLPPFSGKSGRFTAGGGGDPGAGGAAAAGAGGAGVGGIGGIGDLGGNSLNNQGIVNQRGTSTTFQNRTRIQLLYHIAPRWDGDVQYAYYLRLGSNFQDSMTHATLTTLSFQLTDITEINAGYSFRFTEFDGGGTASGQATSHSLNLGGIHKLQPTIPIHLRVSATVTETEADTTNLNFTGNFETSKIFPGGEISLRLIQGIGTGGGLAASTTLKQNAVLTASKNITRFISGFLHFGYGRNRSLSGRTIETDTYQFRGGVNMAVLEWLSAGVTYSHVNQESMGTVGITAASNQIFFGLTGTADPLKFFK